MGRAMKDSGVEWIGEIPVSWNIRQIKHIAAISSGESIDKSEYDDNGQFYIVGSNGIIGKANVINLQHKSIITGRVGSIGTSHIFENVWVTDNALILAIIDQTEIKFLYFVLPFFQYGLLSTGTAQPLITATTLKGQVMPYPSVHEQKEIAAFLDFKCTEIDSILAQTRASIEEYKHLKQAVITQAVTKGVRGDRPMKESRYNWIGNYPADWKEIKIKWLLSERKERSADGLEEPLSMSQKFGLIPTKEMDMVPNMASSFIGAKRVYCGDLVFNKLKAHLGVFSVSCYEGLVSPDYAVYYTAGLSDMKFLEYLFKTPQYIAEFRKKSSGVGAGLTRLYTADLYSIYCALPSLDEQSEIVTYLQEKCSEIDALIAKKEQLLAELESYKKSLIYEYVTGKKEV